MGFQISLCQFHKKSLSERLLGGKAVTLWDELTEHKAVSQKAAFQFLTEDISFFTIDLYGLPNITLQIPQEQSLRKASWRESCNSLRWINRTQRSFSESFFPVFTWKYFLFHHSLLGVPNITLEIPLEQSQQKASWGESSNSVRWINRTQSSFWDSFFPVFSWRYFLFHHSPLWASKYHFANYTWTVLAKASLRWKL